MLGALCFYRKNLKKNGASQIMTVNVLKLDSLKNWMMHLKDVNEMVTRVDPDQTRSSLVLVCSVGSALSIPILILRYLSWLVGWLFWV